MSFLFPRYVEQFPGSKPWDEVAELLFHVPDPGRCVVCGTDTPFLDYTTPGKPQFFCGGECFLQVASKRHKKGPEHASE